MSNNKTYDDTNTGIIGANDYKMKDTHPDQRGRCNVAGLWYWVSGWNKQSNNNRTFTSLAFTLMTQDEVDKMMAKRAEKERPQQGAQQQQAQSPAQTAQTQLNEQRMQQTANPVQKVAQNNEPAMDFDDDIPF